MHGITASSTTLITPLGYPGACFWMLLESACIPAPSEAAKPFAGSSIATSHLLNLHALALTGAAGNLTGSVIAYRRGAWKGAVRRRRDCSLPLLPSFFCYTVFIAQDMRKG